MRRSVGCLAKRWPWSRLVASTQVQQAKGAAPARSATKSAGAMLSDLYGSQLKCQRGKQEQETTNSTARLNPAGAYQPTSDISPKMRARVLPLAPFLQSRQDVAKKSRSLIKFGLSVAEEWRRQLRI